MEEKSQYVFPPRIGTHYHEGFEGHRTLILGAYHYCDIASCPYHPDCVGNGNWMRYDRLCPCYADKTDDYYRLSNSNTIEIDSYLEGDRCPAYSAFTYFMTERKDNMAADERRDFWEHAAFYNYIQRFLDGPSDLDYENHKDLLCRDFPAFASVLEELGPEIIYVWNPAIKAALDANADSLTAGRLVFTGEMDISSITVNRYIYLPGRHEDGCHASFTLRFKDNFSLGKHLEARVGFCDDSKASGSMYLEKPVYILQLRNILKSGNLIYLDINGIKDSFKLLAGILEDALSHSGATAVLTCAKEGCHEKYFEVIKSTLPVESVTEYRDALEIRLTGAKHSRLTLTGPDGHERKIACSRWRNLVPSANSPERKNLKWFEKHILKMTGKKSKDMALKMYNEQSNSFEITSERVVYIEGQYEKFLQFVKRMKQIPSDSKKKFTWDDMDRIFCKPHLRSLCSEKKQP